MSHKPNTVKTLVAAVVHANGTLDCCGSKGSIRFRYLPLWLGLQLQKHSGPVWNYSIFAVLKQYYGI
jgi:hypothetical protein